MSIENTAEYETVDPKQALTKRSGQALGWHHQKLILRLGKAGTQTSHRPRKVGKERLEAVHSQIVGIPSLK